MRDVIEIEPGIRFTPATLEREIRKADAWLEKHPASKKVDANTSRQELVWWRDRCVQAQERLNHVDITEVETLAEAEAWDAKVNYLKRRGMAHEEATREAWRWANERKAAQGNLA